MESSRSRNGIGAGRAGAIVAIAAGLVALPPAFAGEDGASSAPPPDADGIVGNESAADSEPAGPSDPGSEAPAVSADGASRTAGSVDPSADADGAPAPEPRQQARRRGGCTHADEGAETLTNRQIGKAVLCLVNRARKDAGKDRVAGNADLGRVARRHSAKMEAQNCFAHRCAGESSLGKRVKRSGYPDGADLWRFAENLGCSKTARGMVDGWLTDPRDDFFNRRNLLNRKFRDVGVGVAHGSPVTTEPVKCPDTDETATYTLVFGFRTP